MRKPLIDPTTWPRTTISSATTLPLTCALSLSRSELQRMSPSNLAVDLNFAFGGDVAYDRQVLADNRWDHLARSWAGLLAA